MTTEQADSRVPINQASVIMGIRRRSSKSGLKGLAEMTQEIQWHKKQLVASATPSTKESMMESSCVHSGSSVVFIFKDSPM